MKIWYNCHTSSLNMKPILSLAIKSMFKHINSELICVNNKKKIIHLFVNSFYNCKRKIDKYMYYYF